MKSVRFAIDSDLGNVSLVAVAVNRICLLLGFDSARAGEVELCIAEAATNAIRHAYHDEAGHTVAMMLMVGADELIIEVSDSGTGMAADHVQRLVNGIQSLEPNPADKDSLAEGGRGLQLIHDLMDEISYVSGEGINRLRLTKRFT